MYAMNTCGILFCLVSATAFVAGVEPTAYERAKQDNTILMYKKYLKLKSITPFAEEEICDPEKTSCQDDKLTFCAYGMAKVTIPCSSLFDGKSGYCDCENVQCTATRSSCFKPNPEKCVKEGKMPDPKDCRKFTYCNGKTTKSLSCPTGMTYNAEKQMCDVGLPCHNVMCNPKKLLEFVPFPRSPKYYLFCYFGVGEVRECSQAGYTMQEGKCQFQCTTPGLFKDPKDENYKKGMWHSCTLSNNKVLVRETNYCENDGERQLYFNEEKGLCLPDDSSSGGSSTSLSLQQSSQTV